MKAYMAVVVALIALAAVAGVLAPVNADDAYGRRPVSQPTAEGVSSRLRSDAKDTLPPPVQVSSWAGSGRAEYPSRLLTCP